MADYISKTDKGECVFCKIVSGDIKTPGIFWQDDNFMAFLSIFPSTDGFTVVIPKKHYDSDVLAMPDNVLQKFIIAAKKVSNILLSHFEDVGRVGLIMEGTGIDHAHIKLVPMHDTAHFKKGEWKQYHSHNDKFFKAYEGYLSSNDGPKADEQEIKILAERLKKTVK